jgi:hypothetical protein
LVILEMMLEVTVSVCSGCYNKIPLTVQLLTALEAGKSQIKAAKDSVSESSEGSAHSAQMEPSI